MAKRARPLVAIDGPAGAGKSTVAKMVAARLGYLLVDTGALYRCVALAASRAGLTFEDEPRVAELAEQLAERRAIALRPRSTFGRTPDAASGVVVELDGEDVSEAIRTSVMSLGASRVSAIPRVRAALLAMQRQSGERGGVVLEGRDIGTVVFPDADVKFFLTATSHERATRRHAELTGKGQPGTFEATLEEVEKRDKADTERAVAPLKQADDAILVDSSALSIDSVVERMVAEVRAREAR